jgi:hypothetical protein
MSSLEIVQCTLDGSAFLFHHGVTSWVFLFCFLTHYTTWRYFFQLGRIAQVRYYFKLPGWKSYKTTGTRIKSEALTVVQNYLRDQGERTKDITLREYAEPFYDYERCPHIQRIGKNITRKSALVIRQYLKNHVFTDPIAEKPLGKITIRDVAEFRARLEKKQVLTGKGNYLSPSTINKMMAALKVIFTEAVLNRDIPFNPCQGLVRLKPSQNPRGVFSTEELKRFFDKKNWRNIEAWTCFALDALTGMREEDYRNLLTFS